MFDPIAATAQRAVAYGANIIGPRGVDVLDERNPRATIQESPSPLMDNLQRIMIGASRRSLGEIFNDDRVEFAKVMRFFDA